MVFDEAWFIKYQKPIRWFSNTSLGRYLLCINGEKSSVGSNEIIGVLPHAIFWQEGKEYVAEFRTHNKFAKRLYYAFKPVWQLIHAWDMDFANNVHQSLNLGFDTLTFFPDPNPETNSVDGQARREGVNETFTTIRGGAGTTASDTDTDMAIAYLAGSTTSNQYQRLIRGFFLFNTASLSGYSITSATFSLFGGTGTLGVVKQNDLGSPDIHVGSSTPASNTAIVAADYSQRGTTSFGNVTYASWAASYNDFTLNASGLLNISTTGVSKFSTQTSWDINNSFTGAWVTGGVSAFDAIMADNTGTSNDPKLVVVFSISSGGSFLFNFL